MKIGFSSLVAPEWDLEKLVAQAKAYGFDGVELRGIQGQLHLPLVPELAGDPKATIDLFRSHGVDLVCLGTSASLGGLDRREVADQRAKLIETIELAASIECPLVRMFAGEIPARSTHQATISRVAAVLASVADVAARHRVTVVVENGGDMLGSRDLWFIADAVDHPAVRCCWNPCHAMACHERSTTAVPRLASRLSLVHVCDADFDDTGSLTQYQLPGKGQVDWPRTIDWLRGVVYRGYLVFEWPKLWVPSLAGPDAVLPAVAEFLRTRLDHRDAVLSAYKTDKHKPNLPTLAETTD